MLAACKKEAAVTPGTPNNVSKVPSNVVIKTSIDTVPADAVMRLRLIKTDNDYDETMLVFNRSSSAAYDPNEDGIYLQGFGNESLSTISSDGKDLAIDNLPYAPGTPIDLNVETKGDGAFSLAISYRNKIPGNMCAWLKDNFTKDSVDMCKGPYSFNVTKADTNSFGSKRFQLILKQSDDMSDSSQGPN